MGNHSHNALDRRPTPGSVLPVTPYEIWQLERYGNFISECQIDEIENDIKPLNFWIYEQIDFQH